MADKTVIVLTPYFNYQAPLHPDDTEQWGEDDLDRLTELRDQLIELELPGIELQHLGDTPSGHPVVVGLIDTNFVAGEIYMTFREDLLNNRAERNNLVYVNMALKRNAESPLGRGTNEQ